MRSVPARELCSRVDGPICGLEGAGDRREGPWRQIVLSRAVDHRDRGTEPRSDGVVYHSGQRFPVGATEVRERLRAADTESRIPVRRLPGSRGTVDRRESV